MLYSQHQNLLLKKPELTVFEMQRVADIEKRIPKKILLA